MKRVLVSILVVFSHTVFSQSTGDSSYQKPGIQDNLPSYTPILAKNLVFPFSWSSGNFTDFRTWQSTARAKVIECFLRRPKPVPFHPVVLAELDRGNYVACKIVFNLSADSRVLGYLLVPKGKGPFPAILLFHDHGSKFDIGKEKVVEPFGVSTEQMKSSQEWVDKSYGGKFIGDELAKRGYVCFATDALNWSDRGGAGYEGQQAVASNLFNFGMSYAGLIAWEDISAADFLATRPEVDSTRVVALGFSMGSFRAWQVAALSDHIAGSVAICWMATHKGLLVPGGNLTLGQSSYTTTHIGISNYLDYPDVASIACPKPMLFYNGTQDKLFPTSSVEEAYATMHQVWDSQHAESMLTTKLWHGGHVFSLDMQNEAFQWLDRHFLFSTNKKEY
jgi:dienelactone hydrolase